MKKYIRKYTNEEEEKLMKTNNDNNTTLILTEEYQKSINPLFEENSKKLIEMQEKLETLTEKISILTELLVEVFNSTLAKEKQKEEQTSFNEEKSIIEPQKPKITKKIIINRDDKGKIISADLTEEGVE